MLGTPRNTVIQMQARFPESHFSFHAFGQSPLSANKEVSQTSQCGDDGFCSWLTKDLVIHISLLVTALNSIQYPLYAAWHPCLGPKLCHTLA